MHHADAHTVWKMFCVAFLALAAARSSSSTSAVPNVNVRAARLSATCMGDFIPTMTRQPLPMHQLMATADILTPRAWAISRSVTSNGLQLGSSALKIRPRGPSGSVPSPYLPESTPSASGEYPIGVTPSSRQLSIWPLSSGS